MATRQQINQLLIMASAIDNRAVTEEAITAWLDVLEPFDAEQLTNALRLHRRTSTEYVTPAHLTLTIASARKSAALTPTAPAECFAHPGYPLAPGDALCFFGEKYDGDCTRDAPSRLLTHAEAVAAGIITPDVYVIGGHA